MDNGSREGLSVGNGIRRTIGYIALIGFGITAVLHVLTFTPLDFSRFVSLTFLPFIGMFFVFAAMILDVRSRFGNSGSGTEIFRSLTTGPAAFVGPLVIAVVIYVGINFCVCLALTHGGQAMLQDGGYVLISHGSVITTLTRQEYERQQAYNV